MSEAGPTPFHARSYTPTASAAAPKRRSHLTELIKAEGGEDGGSAPPPFRTAAGTRAARFSLYTCHLGQSVFFFFLYLKVPRSFPRRASTAAWSALWPVRREVHPSLLLRTRRIAGLSTHTHTPCSIWAVFLSFWWKLKRCLPNARTGTMTRRSCAIYATVVAALIVVVVLIAGIALAGAQFFQTLIHERLKKVSGRLWHRVCQWSRGLSFIPHFYAHHSEVSVFCRCFTNILLTDLNAGSFPWHVCEIVPNLTPFHILLSGRKHFFHFETSFPVLRTDAVTER